MGTAKAVWRDLDLAVEEHRRGPAPDRLAGVIAFREPLVLDCSALPQAGGSEPDAETRRLAKQSRFTYLRLGLSIRGEESLVLRFVSLDVVLEGGALCWSMQPVMVAEEFEAKAAPAVTPNFELELAAAEPGADAERVVYQPTTQALHVHRADPTWELRAAAKKRLRGTQLFHLVARIPRGGVCQARIGVRAGVLREDLVVGYRAKGPGDRDAVAVVAL
jgi:hypothetical protein